MLRGNRSIFVALAGLVLVGAAQKQVSEQSQSQADTKQGQDSTEPSTSPIPASPSYRPYSERYSDACYNADNHDTADLCAQWRAAIAAEKAANEARLATIASIVGTILSLVTVIGLIVTIRQTDGALAEARRGNRLNLLFERRARREARKAERDQAEALRIARENAQAATKANELAKDAADRARIRNRAALKREQEAADERRAGERRQLRAYLDITHVRSAVNRIKKVKDGHCWRGAVVSLKNFGQTPADELSIKVVYVLKPKDASPLRIAENHKIGLGGVMPSDEFVWRDLIEFPDEAWDEVGGGSVDFYLSVNVSYIDAFGEKRTVAGTYRADGWEHEMGFVPGTRSTT